MMTHRSTTTTAWSRGLYTPSSIGPPSPEREWIWGEAAPRHGIIGAGTLSTGEIPGGPESACRAPRQELRLEMPRVPDLRRSIITRGDDAQPAGAEYCRKSCDEVSLEGEEIGTCLRVPARRITEISCPASPFLPTTTEVES
jgi:hypothetical protein